MNYPSLLVEPGVVFGAPFWLAFSRGFLNTSVIISARILMRRFIAILALSFGSLNLVAEDAPIVTAGNCHTILPIDDLGSPVFLTQDEEKKEAYLTIIATLTEHNYGMNFNGYAKGEAGYQIPVGWKVVVKFCNNSPVPHSVIVVDEAEAKRKINLGEEPYFDGASTPNPLRGTTSKVETFEFIVDEPGDFAIACGFPTHSINGHWIRLDVKKDFQEAAFLKPETQSPQATK